MGGWAGGLGWKCYKTGCGDHCTNINVTKLTELKKKGINNKILLYSTENYSQSPGIDHDEKNIKENMYIYVVYV